MHSPYWDSWIRLFSLTILILESFLLIHWLFINADIICQIHCISYLQFYLEVDFSNEGLKLLCGQLLHKS